MSKVIDVLFRKDFGDRDKVRYFILNNGDKNTALLGTGYFAAVYKVGNRAVKVSDIDKCWLLFSHYTIKKKFKYLPKIHKVAKFKNYFVAVLESLSPIEWGDYSKFVRDPIVLFTVLTHFGYMKQHDHDKVLNMLKSKHPDFKLEFDDEGNVTSKKYLSHPFVKVVKDMEKIAGCRIDLHWDNVMLRGNQLVIIDPIIRTKNYSKNTLNNIQKIKNDRLRAINIFRKRTNV